MDSNGTFARSFDESLTRELPHPRIAPLREPVSSRILSVPLPLEPNASGVRDPNSISKTSNSARNLPPRNEQSPEVPEGTSAARSKKNDFSADPLLEPPPRPILPAFVNLRALERFPYSSFDDDGLHSRKRRRVDVHGDSFGEHLQLPIPQTQKEQRPPPFGPFAILNGLNEPPPNAALLPPIEAGSITQLLTKPSRDSILVEPTLLVTIPISDSQTGERREGRIEDILATPIVEKLAEPDNASLENTILTNSKTHQPNADKSQPDVEKEPPSAEKCDEPISPKTRGRSRKNLRKWTDEETIALLRGVVKCGIGNWTAILAQPELKFNRRSASNLKDRFRVCCPWAYRASDPNEATRQLRDALTSSLSRTETDGLSGSGGKLRLPQPQSTDSESRSIVKGSNFSGNDCSSSSFSSTNEAGPESPKSRSRISSSFKTTPILSSKSRSALVSLGIPEPHFATKSRRRSRRLFTASEDEALLKGYAVHGFQWTLIQQDKRLNLDHRRATDLRDRFRTKFPHAYRDGGSVNGRNLHTETKDAILKDGSTRPPGNKQSPLDLDRMPSDDRPEKSSKLDQAPTGVVDTALPSPVPPQGPPESSTAAPAGAFSFSLDENATNNASVDTSWTANTLPPLLWEDLT
ncbi:hypothetical protein P175DRAFT_0531385 [Aspergillus ochraceoroseus IBT 24754]|uniref:Myb-like domain-containing protein n=2 Tax=Aspergillus ochraceoroseus TaxID=138278 RepID=A0A2T5LZY8_9EURO|nr:uncharacterized protein P175DRAFT_0531385 [Aspergillus ochraceoroseus IBT 24754]KKK24196.1 hypothetical protein AOCH_000789 [Aspergillus ochraceoroseus]PTU21851.1 hypothetical protein P175DRAFT_0531385 [Aspergillus ochraceoroseus IBT 24754]